MESKKETAGFLNLMFQPGFCVKENIVQQANAAALGLSIAPGRDIRPLLYTGAEEYAAFSGGCLYLKLSVAEVTFGASVVRMNNEDVFLLDQDTGNPELQALALAARELREPLTGLMLSANQLMSQLPGEDAKEARQLAQLNRSLHQMLRILGNMSDSGSDCAHPETRNLPMLFEEIFEKAHTLVSHTGVTLEYQGLDEYIPGLADQELLERAILNILSNAVKFTPKGGSIQAKLARSGSFLRLSIADSGSGIAGELRGSLFRRYLRQPGIEDGRCGLGLGMVMVRKAAVCHGGTVLVDQPENGGTRVTMTIAIRQSSSTLLRSPVRRPDYAGERDHALLELSDCLPLELYEKE